MKLHADTLKRELWKKDFRDLFPELQPQIRAFFARPSCGKCLRDIVVGMQGQEEVLKTYFGEEVELPPVPSGPTEQETAPRPTTEMPAIPAGQVEGDGTSPMPSGRPTMSVPMSPRFAGFKRICRTFKVEEVDKGLEDYPPVRFKVEGVSRYQDEISIIFSDLKPQKPKGDTPPT